MMHYEEVEGKWFGGAAGRLKVVASGGSRDSRALNTSKYMTIES